MVRSIGANIKAKRRALGLNQETLAKKLNLTQANVSRIEASVRGPNADMLVAIAKALSCDVRELLGMTNEEGTVFVDLDDDAKIFLCHTIKSDPQFGMRLRSFAKDLENLTEEDWKFLAVNLKLALSYASDVIKNRQNSPRKTL